MLKFILMVSFMIPICLKMKMWVVQNMLFLIFWLMSSLLVYNVYGASLSYFLGMDLISYGLVMLSVWVCSLMILSSEMIYKKNMNLVFFSFLILFLLIMLFLTFSSVSVFLFYLFFESSLIPTLFLVLGWGYQPERLQAGVYLLFYTLLASMPLLVAIFMVFEISFSLNMFILTNFSVSHFFLYLAMIFAFLVKMPMFFVHLWLPKAHVEAPVCGSMILAGILLKLGGYGLMRIFPFLSISGKLYNFWWVSVSLVGGVLISLECLRQVDMSALIAYSSVAHMGVVLGGLMTLTFWGLSGAYTLMLAHGLCSSGLFCLANMSYERLSSRSLLINKGLLNFMPSLSLWWFLLCAGNMAAPPTLNLLGEISLFNGIISWSWFSMMVLSLMSFFSAAYSFFLYSYSQQGKIYSALFSFSMNFVREYLVIVLHWVPLNMLILKSDMCYLWL